MRKGYSTQLRLDSLPIHQVPLNLECRHRIVPILRAVQQVYSRADVTAAIMKLIEADVNLGTRKDYSRTGMDDWHIMVLASVRLGCNFTYDQLHDLAENHGRLRADSFVMQTNIKYPTESSLIRDGLRKIIEICLDRMPDHQLAGWRQHAYLWTSVK